MTDDLLIRAHTPVDYGGADFAVVRLSIERARDYLALIKEAKKTSERVPSFYTISAFNYHPTWYTYHDAFDLAMENGEDHVWLPYDWQGRGNRFREMRVDGCTINILRTSVYWDAYIDNTNTVVETREIQQSLLEEIVEKKGVQWTTQNQR